MKKDYKHAKQKTEKLNQLIRAHEDKRAENLKNVFSQFDRDARRSKREKVIKQFIETHKLKQIQQQQQENGLNMLMQAHKNKHTQNHINAFSQIKSEAKRIKREKALEEVLNKTIWPYQKQRLTAAFNDLLQNKITRKQEEAQKKAQKQQE